MILLEQEGSESKGCLQWKEQRLVLSFPTWKWLTVPSPAFSDPQQHHQPAVAIGSGGEQGDIQVRLAKQHSIGDLVPILTLSSWNHPPLPVSSLVVPLALLHSLASSLLGSIISRC